MIPVAQTIFSPPSGNCLAACVASLFRRPIWLVPNFAVADAWRRNDDGEWEKGHEDPLPRWWTKLGGFAADNGYRVLQLKHLDGGCTWGGLFMHGDHAIVTCKSPRGDWDHCVIADILSGEVVWDPHPDGYPEGHQLQQRDVSDWILFVAVK